MLELSGERSGFAVRYRSGYPYGLSIARAVFGVLFFLHGCQLWGWLVPPGGPVHSSPPPGVSAAVEAVLHVAAGCFAIGGGVLLTFGFFTVQVAFLLSGEMAVAYFLSHAPLGWCPLFNGGESSVLYCFAFLLFSVAGGGAWSIDRWWEKHGCRKAAAIQDEPAASFSVRPPGSDESLKETERRCSKNT